MTADKQRHCSACEWLITFSRMTRTPCGSIPPTISRMWAIDICHWHVLRRPCGERSAPGPFRDIGFIKVLFDDVTICDKESEDYACDKHFEFPYTEGWLEYDMGHVQLKAGENRCCVYYGESHQDNCQMVDSFLPEQDALL